MTRLYVPAKYRLQQTILHASWDNDASIAEGKPHPTIYDLTKLTKRPTKEVLNAVKTLQEKGLVHYNTNVDKVYCTPKGDLILFNEDILDEGWKEFRDTSFKWLGLLIGFCGLILATAKFIIDRPSNKKVELPTNTDIPRTVTPKQKPASAQRHKAHLSTFQPTVDSSKKK